MKRFIIFVLVLGVALLGVYVWWQRNAARVITEEVQRRARTFVQNPENLTVENAPVMLTGLRSAKVPKLVISGENLILREGPTLASARLVVRDLQVAGPPFDFQGVGGGDFTVTVTHEAVTQYLRQHGVRIASVVHIPLNTLSVTFLPQNNVVMTGMTTLPVINRDVKLTASGRLAPSATGGQVDFKVKKVSVPLGEKEVAAAIEKLNPMVDLSEWPVESKVNTVTTGKGTATLKGTITGIRTKSLIP